MNQWEAQAQEEERRRQEEEQKRQEEEARKQAEEAQKQAEEAQKKAQEEAERQARIEANKQAAEQMTRQNVQAQNPAPLKQLKWHPGEPDGEVKAELTRQGYDVLNDKTGKKLEDAFQDYQRKYIQQQNQYYGERARNDKMGIENPQEVDPRQLRGAERADYYSDYIHDRIPSIKEQTAQEPPAEEQRSRGAGNGAETEMKIDRWLNPDYQMSQDERKEARELVRQFNSRYGSQGQLADPASAERIAALDNKSRAGGSFMAGYMHPIMSNANMMQKAGDWLLGGSSELAGGMVDDLAGTDLEGGARNLRETAQDVANKQAESLRNTYQNAQTQNNAAYQAGNLAGNATLYALTNPLFDSIGAAANLGRFGKFLLNQVGQNLQDAVVDTAPTYMENIQNGMSAEDAAREARNGAIWNAVGNLGFGVAGEGLSRIGKSLPVLLDGIGGKTAANLASDADNIIPSVMKNAEMNPAEMARQNAEGVDNILANRQQAADNLESLAKQIPGAEQSARQAADDAAMEVADRAARNVAEQEAQAAGEQAVREVAEQEARDAFPEIVENVQRQDPAHDLAGSEIDPLRAELDEITRKMQAGEATSEEVGRGIDLQRQINDLENAQKAAPVEASDVPAETMRPMPERENGNRWFSEGLWEKQNIVDPKNRELTQGTYEMFRDRINEALPKYQYQGNKALEESVEKMNRALETMDAELQKEQWDPEVLKQCGRDLDAALIRFHRNAKDMPWYDGGFGKADLKKSVGLPGHHTEKQLAERQGPVANYAMGLMYDGRNEEAEKLLAANDIFEDFTNTVDGLMDYSKPGAREAFGRLWSDGADQTVIGREATEKLLQSVDDIQPYLKGEIPQEKLDNLLKLDLQLFADKKEAAEALEQIKAGYRERSFAKNTRIGRVEGIPDEVKNQFIDQPEIYKVLSNAETSQKAQNILDKGFDSARNEFDNLINRRDPAAIPLGHSIAKELSARGDYDGAAEVLRRITEELTGSGQFSQAAILALVKDDPMTAMRLAQKEIDKINKEGLEKLGKKWKNFTLSPEEEKMFADIKPGDEDAIKAAFDKIGKRIGMEYPTTWLDKGLELRKLGMLFNMRTLVRNVLANPPTYVMRTAADRFESVGQHVAHLINPNIKVTQSLRGSLGKGHKLAVEAWKSPKVQDLVGNTAGKYEMPSIKSGIKANTTMFKGNAVEHWIDEYTGKGLQKLIDALKKAGVVKKDVKIDGGIQALNKAAFNKEGAQSVLETYRNLTYGLLELGDHPFVRSNFVDRLGSYINAQGIKSVDDIPDEAIQIAWEEAMKATYKDNSWAVQMLQGFRKGMQKIPVIGRPLADASIPFVQAPGNIAARIADYSPIRGAKGVGDIIKGARAGDEKMIRQGIEEASKGLTGTGMVVLGMKLHEAGILTGAASEDKDQRAFDKQSGWRPFAVRYRLPNEDKDRYEPYDWALPFAGPVITGTLLSEAINNSDSYDSDVLRYFGHEGTTAGKVIGGVKAGTKAAVNSWFDESPLQSLQELMGGGTYGNNKDGIAGNVGKALGSDFAQSFIPAGLNATAKTLDTTQRNTTDKTNAFAQQVNIAKSKLPGASETLPAKYDTWGREVKTGETRGEAFVKKFIDPGDSSYDKSTPIDDEINRLFNETGKNGVFPMEAPTKVGTENIDNKQNSAYQQDMGQRSYKLAEAFINSDGYKDMDDASRAEALATLYGMSKEITERDVFGKEPANNSTYKKYTEAFDKGGVDAVIKEIECNNLINSTGLDSNSNAAKSIREALDAGNTKEAQKFAENAKALVDAGVPTKGISLYDEKVKQIPSIKTEDFADAYLKADKDKNGSLTQDEIIGLMNSDKKHAKKYQDLLWTSEKKLPVLENGQYQAKKASSNSETGSENTAASAQDTGSTIKGVNGKEYKVSDTTSFKNGRSAYGSGYTEKEYLRQLSELDTNGDNKATNKAEIYAYMDQHPDEADKIWATFARKNWKNTWKRK